MFERTECEVLSTVNLPMQVAAPILLARWRRNVTVRGIAIIEATVVQVIQNEVIGCVVMRPVHANTVD